MDKRPIIVINAFEVSEGKAEEFVSLWEDARKFLRTQPGYLSARLHGSVRPGADFRFVGISLWNSVEAVDDAVNAPEFRSHRDHSQFRFHVGLYTTIRDDVDLRLNRKND